MTRESVMPVPLARGRGRARVHFFFSSRRRHTRCGRDWSSDVCSSDLRISDIGEVLVKSPATMMGYYKDEEKTAEAFTEDGFLRTGDKGEIDEMGRLKLTGRIKEIFKTSKGKYIAPAPIENRLMAHDAIEMVCVSGANQTQ